MWRRHSIAAKKAAWDANKSKTYSIMSKQIQIAAKSWADPKMNPSLELALSKARYCGVPRDIIDRAILKWSWQLEGEDLEEVFYEWFGPGGVAIVIKALTGNTNRTASNIKLTLGKYWWSLWLPGSVSWQFKEKWVIIVWWKTKKEVIKWNEIETVSTLEWDVFEVDALNFDIEDLEIQDGQWTIYTLKQNFTEVKRGIESLWYHINEADLQFIPGNTTNVLEEDKNRLQDMIDALENDEDIDIIRNNAEYDWLFT